MREGFTPVWERVDTRWVEISWQVTINGVEKVHDKSCGCGDILYHCEYAMDLVLVLLHVRGGVAEEYDAFVSSFVRAFGTLIEARGKK